MHIFTPLSVNFFCISPVYYIIQLSQQSRLIHTLHMNFMSIMLRCFGRFKSVYTSIL